MLKWLSRVGWVTGGLFLLVSSSLWPVEKWALLLSPEWSRPDGDVLIVLGGGELEDGTIGESSYWRAVATARLWKSGQRYERILFCGRGSARAMREFAGALGVPAAVMQAEENSGTTAENAREARKILGEFPGEKRLILLSSDYHMFRASRVFRKAGLPVSAYPVSDARKRARSWTARWPAAVDLSIETAKVVYYYVTGRL